ncbi:MAG: DnaD domain protein [Anaerolineaceae bacterium]|nr:DnaD domain protein [Anaerolineaceae bacterium]
MSEFGVVHETLQGWVVTHFKDRQAPSTSTERVRAFRERGSIETKRYKNELNKKTVTADVEHSASVSASGSVSSNPEEISKDMSKAARIYEDNFGPLTPTKRRSLEADVEEFSDECVCDALGEAVWSNVFNLRYVEAI